METAIQLRKTILSFNPTEKTKKHLNKPRCLSTIFKFVDELRHIVPESFLFKFIKYFSINSEKDIGSIWYYKNEFLQIFSRNNSDYLLSDVNKNLQIKNQKSIDRTCEIYRLMNVELYFDNIYQVYTSCCGKNIYSFNQIVHNRYCKTKNHGANRFQIIYHALKLIATPYDVSLVLYHLKFGKGYSGLRKKIVRLCFN